MAHRPQYGPPSAERAAAWRDVAQSVMCLDGRRAVGNDDVSADQIDQMRQHRSRRGAAQRWVEPDIEPLNDRVRGFDPRFEAIDDAGLALAAVGDESADMPRRPRDRRTVCRP